MPKKTLRSCNALIKLYTERGLSYTALQMFAEMMNSGHPKPNHLTYPFAVKACGDILFVQLGALIHGLIIINGFSSDTFVGNSLLAMYMNIGKKESAARVFDSLCEKTVVSWNTMISGYFRNDSASESLRVLKKMTEAGVEVDCATVVSVLPACGYLKEVKVGREVHELMDRKGLGDKLIAKNALVDMYVKCNKMDEARGVFDKMSDRDVVTWTSMMNGYILNGDARSAIELCPLMQVDAIRPNAVTLASLLSACGELVDSKHGKCMHAWAIKQKLDSDVNVETALIGMYAKCKFIKHSFQVFSRTSKTRTPPWNAILSGCVHNGLARQAITLFKDMRLEAVPPDDATLKSLLPAYATIADLRQATNFHSYLMRSGFCSKTDVATGLVDIYSKCGSLDYAHRTFNGIPVKDKDIILWSVIIAGYGKHGHGETALSLFNQMVQSGVEPNEVTFTSVLHACSHAGLVDEGLRVFKFMLHRYTSVAADYYTCIVDLLGRAGRLEEAYELIRTMSSQPTHAVWGALLGACVIHENVELGEVAAKYLFEIEPENTGNYVLMGNIYAAVGRWEDAENVREMINKIGLRKAPAHSLVDARNV